MKKINKIAGGLLAACMLLAGVGCGGNNTDKPNEVVTNVATAPDYSASTKKLSMFAYVGPTNGKYTLINGSPMEVEDFRTQERYQEYKDCGFDSLLLLGNDGYDGRGAYEQSDLKMNLDLCESVGLNCIVFDTRLHALSVKTKSLIGTEESWQFADMDALVAHVKTLMADYYEHPAFYGVSIKDEPWAVHLQAIGDLYKAFKIINEERKAADLCELYVNTVMLPYTSGGEHYSLDKKLGSKKAYRDYIQKFLTYTDADAFDYDAYPFKYINTNDCANNPEESYIEAQYFANLQIAVEEAAALGKDVYLTMQSHASTSGATMSAHKRQMEIEDFRWQLNAAFAFGVKDLRYYTYWTFPNHATGDSQDYAIMSDTGEKQYYDMVQTTNVEAQKQAKVVLNFDYVQTMLYTPEERRGSIQHFTGIDEAEKIDGVGLWANYGVVLNEMLDKANNRKGYYVMNAEDPAENVTAKVKLTFEGYKYVAVYQRGERVIYKLNSGVFNYQFPEGEGALLVPFN